MRSGLGGSADGAGVSAGAAFDAGIRVDLVLASTFTDRVDGALCSAGAAADAFFGNFVSHDPYLQNSLHRDARDKGGRIRRC